MDATVSINFTAGRVFLRGYGTPVVWAAGHGRQQQQAFQAPDRRTNKQTDRQTYRHRHCVKSRLLRRGLKI